LKPAKTGLSFSLSPLDNNRLAAITGESGVFLKQIAEFFDVNISHRAAVFFIDGSEDKARSAEKVICDLYANVSSDSKKIDANTVHLALVAKGAFAGKPARAIIKIRKQHISPRNAAQDQYLQQIFSNDICFGIGPAGTGKTYLAVACASQALANNEVERIILVRPAVEAGEKLGFLPGDIGQKVDPYLRPLYDALFEMLGTDRVAKLIERGVIELAPLAYMRGRTLNDAFVLLDEAQNTTIEQMKMFLTRMGQGSKMVINGDTTQIDLPKHIYSGLKHVEKILNNIQGIGFTRFSAKDVVRHSLVQKIVEAYDAQSVSEDRQD
jgi:phosphate starvation-inducible PhoH-like protein